MIIDGYEIEDVVPLAIESLLRVIRPALLGSIDDPDTPIQLMDGPEFEWPEAEFVAVGLSSDDLEIDDIRLLAGLEASTEEADVLCLIRMTSGDSDMRVLRLRAYAQLTAIRKAIEDDRTLGYLTDRDGPHVGNADLSRAIYAPQVTARGRCLDVVFTVHVKNF